MLPFSLTLGFTFGFIEYVNAKAVFSICGMVVTNVQILCLIPVTCFCAYLKILDAFSDGKEDNV